MVVGNIVHSIKIALEMNMGFQLMINAMEFIHIMLSLCALMFFFYR